MSPLGSVPPRTPVSLASLPSAVVKLLPGGGEDRETWRATVLDPARGYAVFHVRFAPEQVGTRHCHTSDTLYVFLQGSFIIPDEGTYLAGDVRWVEAGRAYGPERAGPEGATFLFVSLGPFGTEHLDTDATVSE